ncbi:unnamed protein product [Periconia digitata]|uniref:FAD/NAD(P)-binding domain-containing protein n=1 Tax=Periconia digitata TaxID=1303443 RepID=A0A9W4UIY3_9PLEO|nr:unnamed protein product [Periconia digitata]
MLVTMVVDALIVGAGPAGLSAALGLSRQRRTAVLFDSKVYRNAITPHMHNFPTWDHQAPSDFRAKALDELIRGRYSTTEYVQQRVESVEQNESGLFVAIDSTGKEWHGRKLLIASGVTDIMPDIPGFKETWLNMNIYHCLFCHGFEDSGTDSAGVIAVDNMVPPMAAHFAKMSRPFARKVILYTNGSKEVAEALAPMVQEYSDITIDSRTIKRLVPGLNGAHPAIELDTGSTCELIEHGFFAHQPRATVNIDYARKLNLKLSETGTAVATSVPFHETNVRGCFAAGDISTMFRAVAGAVSAGAACSGGIVSQL